MEARKFSEIRGIADDVEKTRVISFVASSDRKDRHGTILDVYGWELAPYMANPVVAYMHNAYSGADPDQFIGRTEKLYIDFDRNQLIADIKFEDEKTNPLAEKVFRKILAGTFNAVSVGFLPVQKGHWGTGDQARGGKDETYFYGKRQLLEISIVGVPSNTDSVVRNEKEELLHKMTLDLLSLDLLDL